MAKENKSGPSGPHRHRVELFSSADAASSPAASTSPVASIWVMVSSPDTGGSRFFTLLHDYADLKPAAGWHLRFEGVFYAIREAHLPSMLAAPVSSASPEP